MVQRVEDLNHLGLFTSAGKQTKKIIAKLVKRYSMSFKVLQSLSLSFQTLQSLVFKFVSF